MSERAGTPVKGCPGCDQDTPPIMIDEDGTLASISGKPGRWGHGIDDYYWFCDDYADSERPSVDWLDGRESCLIDGVRYTRTDRPPDGAIIVWADCGDIGDGDYRVWLAADADLEKMMPPDTDGFFYFWPVPIDQHPDDLICRKCHHNQADHCEFDEPGVDHPNYCPKKHHEFVPLSASPEPDKETP